MVGSIFIWINKFSRKTFYFSDDLEALDEGKIPETETGKCMIACEFIEYGIVSYYCLKLKKKRKKLDTKLPEKINFWKVSITNFWHVKLTKYYCCGLLSTK